MNKMQMKYELNSPKKPPGLLRKLGVFMVAVAMLGLLVMFSAVLLAIILIVGAMAWTYLWWKTREVRKLMRELSRNGMTQNATSSNDEVFEGEVVSVVPSPDRK